MSTETPQGPPLTETGAAETAPEQKPAKVGSLVSKFMTSFFSLSVCLLVCWAVSPKQMIAIPTQPC